MVRHSIEVNLVGQIAVLQQVIPLLRARGDGVICNITSNSGERRRIKNASAPRPRATSRATEVSGASAPPTCRAPLTAATISNGGARATARSAHAIVIDVFTRRRVEAFAECGRQRERATASARTTVDIETSLLESNGAPASGRTTFSIRVLSRYPRTCSPSPLGPSGSDCRGRRRRSPRRRSNGQWCGSRDNRRTGPSAKGRSGLATSAR